MSGVKIGAKTSTQTFLVQSFFDNPSRHGRPGRKSWASTPKARFPAAPEFLTPEHSGARVRNVRGKFGPKSLCVCCSDGRSMRNPTVPRKGQSPQNREKRVLGSISPDKGAGSKNPHFSSPQGTTRKFPEAAKRTK